MVTESVLERLHSGALAELVDLGSDYVLDQPVNRLVDVAWLAEHTVHSLDAWSHSEQAEDWISDQVRALQARTPQGTLGEHIPTEVSDPLLQLVQRPFVPDRAIIGRLLSHKAVESLVRELLVGALQSFAHKLKPNMPSSSRLRSLKRMGDGVLGGLGSVLEGQAENRVRDFVDATMAQVMGQIADYICNPANSEAFGRFRGHLLNQLFQTPLVDLDRELDKLDPEVLVKTVTASARALAGREGLQAQLEQLIQSAVDGAGQTTLREHLVQAGVADEWHTEVRSKLSQSAEGFVQTEAFGGWLDRLLEPS
jgi:hypothetical protein